MKVIITSEQKWVMGALGTAILAAVPSFFMDSTRGQHSVQASQSLVESVKPKGEAVPILESNWAPRPMSGDEQKALKEALKIDINHADAEELNSLPNVGKATAERIIAYREENGCFRNIEDLREVKGFGGDAKFNAVKDHIRLDMAGCDSKGGIGGGKDSSSKKKSDRTKKSSGAGALVNINTAGVKELDALPGIGKATAERIIEYRNENGPFQSPEDIMNVQGIKEGTFEKIQDMITIY